MQSTLRDPWPNPAHINVDNTEGSIPISQRNWQCIQTTPPMIIDRGPYQKTLGDLERGPY